MNKVAFVILHYETIEDTTKCIDSLIKYNGSYIIVVDNGSNRGKLDEIKNKYNYERIIFIRSEENL